MGLCSISSPTKNSSHLMAIFACILAWLADVVASYDNDSQAKKLLGKLCIHSTVGYYTSKDGLIRYNTSIYIGTNTELQNKFVAAMRFADNEIYGS